MILVFNDRMLKKIIFFVKLLFFLSVIDRSKISYRLGQGTMPGTVVIININIKK